MNTLIWLHFYCNVTCVLFSSAWNCGSLLRKNRILFIVKSSKSLQKQKNIKQRLCMSCANGLRPPWRTHVGGSYSHCWFLAFLSLRVSSGHGSVSASMSKTGQSTRSYCLDEGGELVNKYPSCLPLVGQFRAMLQTISHVVPAGSSSMLEAAFQTKIFLGLQVFLKIRNQIWSAP